MTKVFFLFLFFSLGMVSYSFADSQNANSVKGMSYEIKKGDMLRKISLKYFGTEKKAIFLARINGIKNPDKIRAGAIIKLGNSTKRIGFKILRRKFAPVSGIEEMKIEERKKVPEIEYDVDRSKIVETKKQNVSAEIAANMEIVHADDERSNLFADAADEVEKQEIAIAQIGKDASALDMMVAKLYQEVKKPIIEPSLEFTSDDVMSENVPELKEAAADIVRSASILSGIENQLSLNGMSSKNRVDEMTGGMLDYMAWSNIPNLGENFSLGVGVFASAWEDKISNARIRAITPGMQLGLKYIDHSEDHLVRMVYGKVMAGKSFRSVSQKSNPVLFSDGDPMLKTISMESEDAMSTGDLMELNAESEDMNQMTPIKSENYYRLGSMLGAHYQLNQKSTLELMNENWFSLGDKTAMEMDPTFSLIGSHVYTSGNWSLKSGLGPQYEDWSKTWRLHVVPAEIIYKEFISLGFFSDMYPWKKGAMYGGLRSRDLNSIGAALSFNFGKSIHEGHEISSKKD